MLGNMRFILITKLLMCYIPFPFMNQCSCPCLPGTLCYIDIAVNRHTYRIKVDRQGLINTIFNKNRYHV